MVEKQQKGRKRIKLGLFAAALSILSLAVVGCGNKDGGKKSEGGKSEISYALWDKEQAVVFKEIAKDFEEENPDIKIKLEVTPWAQYWTKLETAITGKNAPDVFWLNIPKSTDYIESGVVEPLNDYKLDTSAFPKQYIESYTHEGKLYGIPKDFDTNGLWYNKKIFDDAGVAYPDDTWTWDTWLETAKKLTDEDKGIYGMATPVTWQGGYYETIYQNEGQPFTRDGKKSAFDQPATIEGVEFWHKFSEQGSAVPVETMASTTQSELLQAGKVAMAVDGSYMTPVFFKEDYGLKNIDVAPLPKGKKRATTSNALANVMSAHSKNKESAAKWIDYLSSEKVNKKIAESGVVIPAREGTQDAWINSYKDKNIKVFVDAVEYAVPLPNNKNGMSAIAIETEIFNEAWMGNKTVKEASEEYAKKANELLSK
ncbi:sugar ABC transporter substrate-binding protein [Vagococcus carniphilus]|uniref:ABC transporter substrate-binding protein n=1 Tax=Vagococcus carniphilus TaxID=218144 RepID=UPI00288FF782|nr:sugar ABC transporter substrate-binding protein [Vagococcus carniphilus]MDT2813377.1 sugar ABC transporter substrate-binding protein [Vagococcus carniphilus]MDT2848203.1 sugar ABC transporter substrate-binding protein [Vagococcus carniphilus]MDT2865204.1 sugar ABC transporter substrate-binding protein [Vagococcus carniphilus]